MNDNSDRASEALSKDEATCSNAGVESQRPRVAFGIRGQLLLAFCAMAGLTVLAGGVAWYAFVEISRSVTRITEDSVPAMSASLSLAEKSAEISALAPALMASTNQVQRAGAQARLDELAGALIALVDEFKTANIDPDSIEELRDVHQQITTKFGELNSSVNQRLRIEVRRRSAMTRLSEAHTRFLEILEPMVDDAVFEMVVSSEELTARSSSALTELVDQGVIGLNQLMAVSAEANLAAGLLVEAANVSDPSFIQPLRERFIASAAKIGRNLRALPDSGSKLKLQNTASELLAVGSGEKSIFALRERELRQGLSAGAPTRERRELLVTQLKTAHQAFIETLVPIADAAIFDLVISSEEISSQSRDDITRLVDGGVNTLRLLLSMRADGNLVVGLLAETAGVLEPSLLQPLRERFTAARSHVDNSLGQLPRSMNDSDLREAVSGLLAIGGGADNIFELRRLELAQAARSERLLISSQLLAVRLRDEVAGLVNSAKRGSERAAEDSEDAIQGGELLLVVIMAVSILGAAVIMLFYVGRRVIRPLRLMTAAMTELAAGDTSVDIPVREHTDEVGDMAKALKVFRDTAVEVQKTNLREIRETRRRLIDAIESISEGFSLYDADDRLVVFNTHYRQINFPGMHDVVTIGASFEDLLREDVGRGAISDAKGRVEEWIEERMAQHRDPGGTHIQQRSDGRWVRFNERKTEDGGIVAVFSDITEDRQREEELREAKEKAEETLHELTQTQQSLIHAEKLASLGQLTAGIAHEIKNPLNFVNNFAESSGEVVEELKESFESALAGLDEETREDMQDQFASLLTFLSKIKEHGKRADGIVKSMLSHASEGSGEVERTDLNALIDETMTLCYHSMRGEHRDWNVELERNLDPDVGELDIYPQEMTRVFLNLIGNGFYALRERQSNGSNPDYRPKLVVTTRNFDEQIEVRIRDNGTGIPASAIDKIFNPFYTTKPTGEGTGLGLSLSHETVVIQHQGQLQVDTRDGEYTEFIITLPRKLASESTTGAVS